MPAPTYNTYALCLYAFILIQIHSHFTRKYIIAPKYEEFIISQVHKSIFNLDKDKNNKNTSVIFTFKT